MKRLVLLLAIFIPIAVSAQTTDDVWKPLRPLIGKWQGVGDGEPGKGEYQRTFTFVLDNKYIEIRNTAVYKPQAKNPKGETHEDIGYISYDKARKSFVLRQFHKEGYVNQYLVESISTDGTKFVFVSESIENIPVGWRARETWQISGDKFSELFELAAPGKDFSIYTRVELSRTK